LKVKMVRYTPSLMKEDYTGLENKEAIAVLFS
jgi:hypothetical protein